MQADDVRNELVRIGREFLAALVDTVSRKYGKLKPSQIYKLIDERKISQDEADVFFFLYYNTDPDRQKDGGRYNLAAVRNPAKLQQPEFWQP